MNNSNPQNKLFKILGEIPTELSSEQVELLISGFPDSPMTEKSWWRWFSLNTMLLIMGSISVLIFSIFAYNKNDFSVANGLFLSGDNEAVLKKPVPVLTDTLEKQPKVNHAHASSHPAGQLYDKHSRKSHGSSASTHAGHENNQLNDVTFQENTRYDTTYIYSRDSLGNISDTIINIARVPINKNFATHGDHAHSHSDGESTPPNQDYEASYYERDEFWKNMIQVTLFSICCFFFGRLMVKSFIHR